MSDSIKCSCPACGAKYRLPAEAQGRSARCKACGGKFDIPAARSLEDTVLDWLAEPRDVDDDAEQPRVINIPRPEPGSGDTDIKRRGLIRFKEQPAPEKAEK